MKTFVCIFLPSADCQFVWHTLCLIHMHYTWVSSEAFWFLSFRIALMFLLQVKGWHVYRVMVCEGAHRRSGHWFSAPFVQVPGIELRALGLTASALAC